MFRILYSISIWKLNLLSYFFSLFSKKIETFFYKRDNSQIVPKRNISYWFHCASLGEYEMALPLIQKVLETSKKDEILITFFSPSGYDQAMKGEFSDRIMYLPIDRLSKVQGFYREYSPNKAVFIRYDFWFNIINEGLNNRTEFYLVNGRFTESHFIFKWYGKPYKNLLSQFKQVMTSDPSSSEVLKKNQIHNAVFTGDTRFDRVADIAKKSGKFPDIRRFKGARKLLMLGSSWPQEEQVLKRLLNTKPKDLAIVIAPHDLKRTDDIVDFFKDYNPKLYSENNYNNSDNVLVLNTMGMLSSMYQYADFAFIGGGFSGALHNILEPAVWGCHISFGPNIQKFPEAADFIKQGIACSIQDTASWIDEIYIMLKDHEKLEHVRDLAIQYTSSQIGATKMIEELVL
ncbi:MAG: 3-deoxy-D-manno-octulosonic acid transferase [Bacteroidia bacterium]